MRIEECRRIKCAAVALVAAVLLAACGTGSDKAAVPRTPAPGDRFLLANGDFENDAIGTMPPSSWTLLNYLNANGVSGTSSAPPSSFPALNLSGLGTAVNDTYVVGGATLTQADPDLGTGQTFRFPLYGQRAARLNYKDATTNGKNKNANVLRQKMIVSLGDVDPADGQIHVRFAVAPVLENPSHSFNQQPFFYVELLNLTRGTTLYTGFNTAGQAGVPWHTTTSVATNNATQWLDWALVDLAPGTGSLAIGDQVQLTIVASGCSLGAHFGRIYVDGVGSTIPGPYVSAIAPQVVSAGSTLTYTIRYANGGTTAALGAHVEQTMPPNTTFNSVSGITGCTTPTPGSTGTVSCPLGTLNPGASGTFTITMNVASTATGTIVNGNYSIGAVNQPTLLGAKVSTPVTSASTHYADIVVVKTAGVTAVQPGTSFTSGPPDNPLYTITVTNTSTTDQIGQKSGHSLSFTDTVPPQVTGVTWTCAATRQGGSSGTKCRDTNGNNGTNITNGSGSSISLTPALGTDAGSGGGQITIEIYGTISASASGTIVNTASTSAPSGTTDPNLANNTSTATIFVGTPATLNLTKAGGNANGSVLSSPAGINCGTSCGSASGTFANGSQVVLTASPIAGASFTGWSGSVPASCTATPKPTTCTVTMSGTTNVTATFAAAPAVGAPAAIYVYGGNNQAASTGTAFASLLAVFVADANGVPVPNATVSFAAVPATGGASATLGSGTATTNASGIATLAAIANATPGTYSVNATVGSVATPATFTLTNVGLPASIVYVNGGTSTEPQIGPVNAQFAQPLVALVRDAANNPVPGATVTYTAVPASGASCTVSNGTTTGATVTATTDASGMSSVTATANATVGSYTVAASLGALTPVSFYLQNATSGPAALYVVSGSPQTAPTTSAFANPLVVVVADASGNSLPGITVTFTAPASGATATLSSATATTDSGGLASVTATANATGGTYSVVASATGATSASFSLTNDGGQTLQVQGGSPQSTAINTAFASQLQALVLDDTGAGVKNAVVTFQAPTSGATAALSGGSACVPAATGCMTATTNNSGIASLNATANALSGQYSVVASTATAATPISFSLTNQCTASSQCAGTTPICDTTAHACVACSTNLQCSAKNPAQAVCDGSGSCFGCNSDTQCSGGTPICSEATNSCVACTTDAQCGNKDATKPYCSSGTCFAGWTVTTSAGSNGSVSPSGAQSVAPGGSLPVSIVPNAHYHVANVLVDGSSVGAVSSYSFTNVAANHTLSASFAIDQIAVTASSGGNGTLVCSTPVDYGASSTCTISPSTGYQLATLTDDGGDVTSQVISGSYVASNVTAARAIAATFVKAQGTSCGGDAECASGHCTDGVCCDSACGGQCQACDVAGSQGVCTAVLGTPHGARFACAADGSACDGFCDGSNGATCSYPDASAQCRAPSCSVGVQTVAASCAGTGACPALVTQSCGTYVCGATACKTTCAADADCSAGNYCNGSHQCVAKKPQAAGCGAANECASGICTDGVCCNAACSGQCQACDVGGSAGTCTTVSSGAPHGTRSACASDGSACGGTCDGTSAVACDYPGSSTQCRVSSCSAGVETVAASCASNGSCPALLTHACGTYVCGATACNTTCSADADCSAGNYCNGSHQCVAKKALAAGCGAGNECTSGACVDGVCCSSACGGQCQACDVAGSVGTCATVPSGAPHGTRSACTSDGSACGGTCDGTSAVACDYPGASASCRTASCSGGVETIAASCAGTGSCPAVTTHSCGTYACGATACNTTCSGDGDCGAGNYCNASHQCAAKKALAAGCGAANECASGVCTDGVCCNVACGGQCQACDVVGNVGTCTTVASGAPHGGRAACTSDASACGGSCDGASAVACDYPTSSTQCRAPSCSAGVETVAASCAGTGSCPALVTHACGAYACGAAACNATCSADTDCSAGNYCSASHQCVAKKALAAGCGAGNECTSGACVDGVCCNSACGGQCQACDVAGSVGTCGTVASGAPHGTRSACTSDGSSCGGTCDGTSATSCDYPSASTQCRPASCTNGTETVAASCAGTGSCPAIATNLCAPYVCGATACKTSCGGDADCKPGNHCDGVTHQCLPNQPDGSPCVADAQCASDTCVDGVCCDRACAGQCEACDISGHAGTCTTLTAGSPHGSRAACASDGSTCAGSCDGSSAASCGYPGSSTQCRAGSCNGGVETIAASCAGDGTCPDVTTHSCGAYACGTTTCNSTCSTDADCSAGNYCDASHGCVPQKPQAAACSADDQCATNHCADGYCCDAACNGQCEACDVAGNEGTCSPASGAPHAGHTACVSDGTVCGGSCDGVHSGACTYPGVSLSCRDASCSAGTATLASGCDGQGHCPGVQTQPCAPYVCGANACAGNCSADSDCASGNWCSGGVCVPPLALGQSCGGTNQCGSGNCVDGVCCNSACTGQCEACAEPGSAGTCTAVAGAPRSARAACADDGSVCGGACNGSNRAACAYPATETTCRNGSCASGVAVMAATCNGTGACPAEQDVACTPYVCGSSSCLGDCVVDSDCTAGNYCAAGVCTAKAGPGIACGGSNRCATGACVDGVCCTSACNGQCEACDVPGSIGQCTNVAGAPHGARQACTSDGSLCGGICDGTSATSCAYPASQTVCRGASCAAEVATLEAACDGAGRCPAQQTQGCSPYQCGPGACLGNCGSDAECAPGNFCAGGVCKPQLANGQACSGATQCGSGECVDGVCCNAACGGQCQACDVAGSRGTCTTVVGAPHGARQACASDGSACGGTCNGSSAVACSFPGPSTMCRAGSCSASVMTETAMCDGSGSCPSRVQDACGSAGCSGAICASGTTTCTTDAQCGSGSSCVAGTCHAKGAPGVWTVAGSGGCSSGGAGSLAPAWALALVTLWQLARRRSRALALLLVAAAGAASAQSVPVQPQFDADRFDPGPGSGDILVVGGATVPEHLDVHLSLFTSYARDPLRLIATADATQQFRLLHSQTLLHAGASIGLFGRFELGVSLPVLLAQSASSNDLLGTIIAPGEGIGDLRVLSKAQLWGSETLDVALAVPVTFPTGNGDAFLSQGSVTVSPEVRVESAALPVRLAASAGVLLRGGRDLANLSVGNAVTWGVGGEWPFSLRTQRLAAIATLAGEIELQQAGSVERPMELMAALRWLLPGSLQLTVGGGPGLTDGYGTPRYRVFAGIGFDPAAARLSRKEPAPVPVIVQEPPPAAAPVVGAPPPPIAVVQPPPTSPPPEPKPPEPPHFERAVRNGHLALLAQVQFAHDKATILPVSAPVLAEIAGVLRDAPEIRKVRVEGHTDNRGKPAYNRRLSQRRAESVLLYLVNAGIARSRLLAKGFGADRPILLNDTAEHRAKNRRVEFIVLDGPNLEQK